MAPWKHPAKHWRWIDHGIKRLTQLKRMEVEWCGKTLSKLPDEVKLTWCERVSERFNEGRAEGARVEVVWVKRLGDW